MSSRDDIVIVPRIQGVDARNALQPKLEKEIARAARFEQKSPPNLRRALIARKLARLRGQAAKRRATFSARAGAPIRSTGQLGRAAAAGGRLAVGGLLLAGIVGVAAFVRLASGRSFENLGAELRKTLLGDLGTEAIANSEARASITSDPTLLQIIGRDGAVNDSIAEVFRFRQRQAFQRQRGRELFEESIDFQSNGLADILIVRAGEKILSAFRKNQGEEAIVRVRDRLGRRLAR